MKCKLVIVSCFLLLCSSLGYAQNTWKAGTARAAITPKQPIWMGGFASRDRASESVLHDIWAKALAIEDAKGNKALLITMDLLGISKPLSDGIRQELLTRYGLTKGQVILSTSHTHSGPVLDNALVDIYPVNEAQSAAISTYTQWLKTQVIEVAGKALKDLAPATIYAQNGVTRFQVNRRNNPVATLNTVPDLNGPNEYSVPVLKVVNQKGELKAITFGYACHPTVLNTYGLSGDYVGFAQIELEKYHPGAQAMFFQGAGADQNPLPRGTVAIARQYGRELAAAVDRVLEEDMKLLTPQLTVAYSEAALPLREVASEAELTKIVEETKVDYYKRWAQRWLQNARKGVKAPVSYPYPVQVWKMGDQSLVTLGGEVVVEYAIKIKQLLGPSTFVMGYANDVMGYIPSSTIVREGGYEGETSQMVYGQPAAWRADLETVILTEVKKVADQAGVKIP